MFERELRGLRFRSAILLLAHHGNDADQLYDEIVRLKPAAAIIALGPNSDQAVNFIERLNSECPGTALISAAQDASPDMILRSLRAGAREFLRIPTYGQVVDEDPVLHASEWKAFWILWKAGVRVLLVGGTSGSCDWRRTAADESAVRPGDFVLPKSYLTRDTMPTGLPGTELEFCLPRQVAIMDDPFCPPLAEVLRADAERLGDFRFRRVHGPEAGVVLNRWLAGNGFESLATCRMLEVTGKQTCQRLRFCASYVSTTSDAFRRQHGSSLALSL